MDFFTVEGIPDKERRKEILLRYELLKETLLQKERARGRVIAVITELIINFGGRR